jgi:hypothetical protein
MDTIPEDVFTHCILSYCEFPDIFRNLTHLCKSITSIIKKKKFSIITDYNFIACHSIALQQIIVAGALEIEQFAKIAPELTNCRHIRIDDGSFASESVKRNCQYGLSLMKKLRSMEFYSPHAEPLTFQLKFIKTFATGSISFDKHQSLVCLDVILAEHDDIRHLHSILSLPKLQILALKVRNRQDKWFDNNCIENTTIKILAIDEYNFIINYALDNFKNLEKLFITNSGKNMEFCGVPYCLINCYLKFIPQIDFMLIKSCIWKGKEKSDESPFEMKVMYD